MNKTIITWLAIIALVVLGIILYKNNADTTPEANQVNTGSNTVTTPDQNSGVGTQSPAPGAPAPTVKSFTVTGSNYTFAPSLMTVNKGDTVRITFVNDNGQHDLKIDEFSAATRVLNAGESQTIEFVATKSGGFEYYCSVGQHRQMGMKGTLIVQ